MLPNSEGKLEINKAQDLVKSSEQAVVVFTKGIHFKYDAIGTGETGNWAVEKEDLKNVKKVIVYWRDEKSGVNRIFLGDYTGLRKCPGEDRYVFRFSRLNEVGCTESNWIDFGESGQNPVSFVGDFY